MRIWVDGQCFQTASNVRGIGRYVADLLRALSSTGDARLIISLNGNLREEAIAARNYLRRLIPDAELALWYGLAVAGEFQTGYSEERRAEERILVEHINMLAPDIALSPSPFEGKGDRSSPFIDIEGVKATTACIFHDAIPHRYSDIYLRRENDRKPYNRRFERIDAFDLVLCNSEFTASEYASLYRRNNAVSIGAGLSDSFADLTRSWRHDSESAGARLGRYILYVGGMDWRKNLAGLVQSASRVPECIAGELKLVLAGDGHPDLLRPLRDYWNSAGLNPANLVSTGWVSDAQLVDLYRCAAVAVQPSLMEGFGLTALEAMAAGCPFLSARGGAVAEVVGNEAVLFDPHVPPHLTHLITRALNDAAFRARIIRFGEQRVKAFSWAKSARIAFDAMSEAASQVSQSRWAPRRARPKHDRPRLIMDVTSTAQSPVMSGIQRVTHRLSAALLDLNATDAQETVLSYCRDETGWHEMPRLAKSAISLDPRRRLGFQDNDAYFLLDSSWTFTEGQRQRLVDALALGQEVIHGIHDIGPLTMSAMTDAGMPSAFRKWFEFILGHSTGLVCVSRAVADEIFALLEAIELPRPMKIGYFRLGADFANVTPDSDWLNFAAGRPTFLMVGTIEPRKGHVVALEAFERLWADGVDVNLLIIGKSGWNTSLLQARLTLHPEAERRLFVRSDVSDAELQGAYRAATALVMSSYLEGFGLPVVEAGRLGCPAILSDIPVFREVGAGAPATRFFPRGDADALAAIVREVTERGFAESAARSDPWPSWADSAREVKQVLYGGDWYRRYEPKEILPNSRLVDIGKIRVSRALTADESKHSLRYVEGPLLSDDGAELHFAVALRNGSDVLWSSYTGESPGLEIHVGSHVYARNGLCLDFENPRTKIPFVLCPGEEIHLPVRVSTDWLTRDAAGLGIEVVQEGVTWFGEALRLSLLSPPAASGTPSDGDASVLLPKLFRGPFGRDLANEQYFLFALFNPSHDAIASVDEGGQPRIRAYLLNEAGDRPGGCWIVNCFDVLAPGGYGFLCVYVSGDVARSVKSLTLELGEKTPNAWRLDLATLDLAPLPVPLEAIEAAPSQPRGEVSTTTLSPAPTPRQIVIPLRQTSQGPQIKIATRGFHASEETHTWMDGRSGEIDLGPVIPDVRRLRRLELTCSSLRGLSEPMQLRVLLGERELGAHIISTDFMTYGFDVHSGAIGPPILPTDRLRLVANQSKIEEGGERNLSIALSKIVATL